MPDSPLSTACPPARHPALAAGEERARQLVQEGAPLAEILAVLVQTLEAAADQKVVGSILLLDEQSRLRHGAAPSLPAIYNRAIDGIEAGPYGTCCAAAHRNEVVITTDIEHDPGWAKLKDYPLAIRLLAAWSHPIRARDGRVLGTFGMYFRERRGPTELEVTVVEALVPIAARAIEENARHSEPAVA